MSVKIAPASVESSTARPFERPVPVLFSLYWFAPDRYTVSTVAPDLGALRGFAGA